VVQGLHYLGPDDPRLDRFCRVLAAAGNVIAAPFVRSLCALRVTEQANVDVREAFDELSRETRLAPSVFSISFGSLPAISVAAEAGDRVRALFLFGGYADFDDTVRFAAGGAVNGAGDLPRDPLNLPAVMLNIVAHLGLGDDTATFEQALWTMVRRTWGRVELKAPGARDAIAHAIAEDLPAHLRRPFLLACGLDGDPLSVVARGLASSSFTFADPRRDLARLKAPAVIVHGREDDVVPWTEALKLRDALPPGHPHALLLTGLYGHTGAERPRAGAVLDEGRTLLRIARALASPPFGDRASQAWRS
jgi:pimeloyl-ACP methyl ester carboxylesterase